MLDNMLIEAIGLQFFLSLENRKLLGRGELKKKSLHLAVRAIALNNRLREIELYLVSNVPAVARALKCFHMLLFYSFLAARMRVRASAYAASRSVIPRS